MLLKFCTQFVCVFVHIFAKKKRISKAICSSKTLLYVKYDIYGDHILIYMKTRMRRNHPSGEPANWTIAILADPPLPLHCSVSTALQYFVLFHHSTEKFRPPGEHAGANSGERAGPHCHTSHLVYSDNPISHTSLLQPGMEK